MNVKLYRNIFQSIFSISSIIFFFVLLSLFLLYLKAPKRGIFNKDSLLTSLFNGNKYSLSFISNQKGDIDVFYHRMYVYTLDPESFDTLISNLLTTSSSHNSYKIDIVFCIQSRFFLLHDEDSNTIKAFPFEYEDVKLIGNFFKKTFDIELLRRIFEKANNTSANSLVGTEEDFIGDVICYCAIYNGFKFITANDDFIIGFDEANLPKIYQFSLKNISPWFNEGFGVFFTNHVYLETKAAKSILFLPRSWSLLLDKFSAFRGFDLKMLEINRTFSVQFDFIIEFFRRIMSVSAINNITLVTDKQNHFLQQHSMLEITPLNLLPTEKKLMMKGFIDFDSAEEVEYYYQVVIKLNKKLAEMSR